MLDIKTIREDEQSVRSAMSARNADPSALDRVTELDGKRRALVQETESLKKERNEVSKQIGALKKAGEDTEQQQASMRKLGDSIKQLDSDLREVDAELDSAMLRIPNIPHPTVPVGSDESANKLVRTVGNPRKFDFEPLDHVDIGERLDLFDFARAARMTGAGFPLFKGAGARLERALIQFMLDLHTTEHGYMEVSPPILVNSASMTGTGQLPKLADDMYCLTDDDLYLIPTAEVPLTNLYREEIISDPLPIYLTGHTPCFRREAGAAGKDTRGLLRVHQFDKVEMVKIVEPESSYDELEKMLANAETVLQRLGLHYRVLELCTGDISFAAAKCYDIELWAPGKNAWLEVSSCSNCEAFQARRAQMRYRRKDGKVAFPHTLNGSGVALPRLVVAILENGQQADGSVTLPEAIVPYMGGMERIGVRSQGAEISEK